MDCQLEETSIKNALASIIHGASASAGPGAGAGAGASSGTGGAFLSESKKASRILELTNALRRQGTLLREAQIIQDTVKGLLVHAGHCRLYPQYYAVRLVGSPLWDRYQQQQQQQQAGESDGERKSDKHDLSQFLLATDLSKHGLTVLGVSIESASAAAASSAAAAAADMADVDVDADAGFVDEFGFSSNNSKYNSANVAAAAGLDDSSAAAAALRAQNKCHHQAHAARRAADIDKGAATWLLLRYDVTAYPLSAESYKQWSHDIAEYISPADSEKVFQKKYGSLLGGSAAGAGAAAAGGGGSMQQQQQHQPPRTHKYDSKGQLIADNADDGDYRHDRLRTLPPIPAPSASFVTVQTQLAYAFPEYSIYPSTTLVQPAAQPWCDDTETSARILQVFPAYPKALCKLRCPA
jgi:hypothetical protein